MNTQVKLAPMFPRFNVAVLHISGLVCPRGYAVVPHEFAPASLSAQQAYYKANGRVAVDQANSGTTIYGDPEVNYAFRAWHEMTHIHLQAAFSPDGEERVARAQIADVAKLYGAKESELFASLIWCEIVTQAEHYRRTGRYVADQRAFTLASIPGEVVRALAPRSLHPRGWEVAAPVAA